MQHCDEELAHRKEGAKKEAEALRSAPNRLMDNPSGSIPEAKRGQKGMLQVLLQEASKQNKRYRSGLPNDEQYGYSNVQSVIDQGVIDIDQYEQVGGEWKLKRNPNFLCPHFKVPDDADKDTDGRWDKPCEHQSTD